MRAKFIAWSLVLVLPGLNPAIAAPGDIFKQPSALAYHAPDFAHIKDSDFQPGLEEGMKEQRAEVAAIAANPAPPTFDNTIVALERSGQMLDRVSDVFSDLTSANTDDTLQKVETTEDAASRRPS
jgi:peptidyl-dipeptidase Dcp